MNYWILVLSWYITSKKRKKFTGKVDIRQIPALIASKSFDVFYIKTPFSRDSSPEIVKQTLPESLAEGEHF